MSHHQKSLPSLRAADTVTRGLGWFSIGLGAYELFGAKSLCRWLGIEQRETLVRAFGVREIVNGIGILASRDPTPWVWGRVAGDALDLATLGAAMTDRRAETDRVAFAAAAVAGVTILDVICAESLGAHKDDEDYDHWDYSDRSGLPQSPQQMRGAARDFEVPPDMRIPDALRPYEQPERLTAPGRPM